MKKMLGGFLLSCIVAWGAVAAPPADRFAYAAGEYLKFTVSYKSSYFFNIDVGSVVMRVADDSVNGIPAYRIEGTGTTNSFFENFYVLHDTYRTWIDKQTFKPLKATSDLNEGPTYKFTSIFDYDWNNNVARTQYRTHHDPSFHREVIKLEEGTMDALALFFNLRNQDISSYTIGEERVLSLLLQDTVRHIRYKYYGPETRSVKGLGKVSTLKFSCQLATSTGESFDDGSEFYLWVTNDPNKVPVYMESPIKVGSVRVRLSSYTNLKDKENSVLR